MDPFDIFVYIFPGGRDVDSDSRICRCARLFFEETGQDCDGPLSVSRPSAGRPFLNESGMPFFSVSHSGSLWVCAVSARRVGFDIQNIVSGRNLPALARRFFHPDEKAFLEKNGYKNFFSVWAAKESVVKYTGDGIAGGFSGFSVVKDSFMSDAVNGLRLRHIDFNAAYAACVCYDGPDEAGLHVVNETEPDIRNESECL